MAADFVLKAGDRLESLQRALFADNVAVDITGSTVKLKVRRVGSLTLIVDAAAVIVAANPAVVRYDWSAGDATAFRAAPGSYEFEFEETRTDGKIRHFPNDGYYTLYAPGPLG